MMPHEYVSKVLGPLYKTPARYQETQVFMPSNIALIKYWGKRAGALNLPVVSSLSLTLKGYGTETHISLSNKDSVTMNGRTLSPDDKAYVQVQDFLNLFRADGEYFSVVTKNNIPTASGVASSASGFAALTAAIVKIKGWDVPLKQQSMLARLGSGSAARSFWQGCVLWHKGVNDDGLDCYAEPCTLQVKDFCMSVLVLESAEKQISSRKAMELCFATSPLSQDWPQLQQAHLEQALHAKDFTSLGEVVEENVRLMHKMIETSVPSITYDNEKTKDWKNKVLQWRREGLPVYFTQDAGAQLKLIFPQSARQEIEARLSKSALDYFTVQA